MLLLAVLAMMVLPLPPFVLDVLFTFNIALSLMVVMAVVQHRRGRWTSRIFPTVLLLATLLRLALNVASTRVVLLHGHTGTGAAGQVIEAFGQFVVGGNYAVGIVVFAILTIINFVVVTKGAGRIAEVGARFTLDAMPGKQMAIDADLNAGLIDEDEARAAPRRGARGGRLLRRHGRRQQVRARRRHRRHPDPVHQHHRRPRRSASLSHGLALRRRGPHLHAADHRRRPGGADPGAAALDRGRPSSSRAVARRRTWAASCASSCSASPQAWRSPAALLGVLGLIPGMPNLVFLLFGGGLRRRRPGC